MSKNEEMALSPVMSDDEREDWIARVDRLCAVLTYQGDSAGAYLARTLTRHLAGSRSPAQLARMETPRGRRGVR